MRVRNILSSIWKISRLQFDHLQWSVLVQFKAGIHNKVQIGPKAGYERIELWIFAGITANKIVACEKQNLDNGGIILIQYLD